MLVGEEKETVKENNELSNWACCSVGGRGGASIDKTLMEITVLLA